MINGMKPRARPYPKQGISNKGKMPYLLRKPTEIQPASGLKAQENADAPPIPTGEYRRRAD